MTTDVTRTRAMTELGRAARAAFADLDLRMAGSTPRQWIGDRGWWVVNVEFQASRVANTAMLNVGVQHLWTFFDGRAFDFGGRMPGVSADLTGRDDVVRAAADRIAAAAREAVCAIRNVPPAFRRRRICGRVDVRRPRVRRPKSHL